MRGVYFGIRGIKSAIRSIYFGIRGIY